MPMPLMSAFQLNLTSWSSQNLSNLPLKLSTDSALTAVSGKLFHRVLTLLEKENLRTSYLSWPWASYVIAGWRPLCSCWRIGGSVELLLRSIVRLFVQWAAANCAALTITNAGQYATLQCKPLLFWFPCKQWYINVQTFYQLTHV